MLGAILKTDNRRTQTNGPENKKDDDDIIFLDYIDRLDVSRKEGEHSEITLQIVKED